MASALLPATILPALRELQMMLQQFWADDMPDEGIPIAFWTIRDDALFFDALQYLPCCIFRKGGPNGDGHSSADLALLPKGFQLATSIFQLEDEFAVNGWTAIPNLGQDQLSQVIEAYAAVGLPRRAEALRRVLKACLASPVDEEAEDCYSAAAQGELPDLVDDEAGCAVVLAFLRSDPAALFGTIP
jgi:hypothetical protein